MDTINTIADTILGLMIISGFLIAVAAIVHTAWDNR